MQDVFAKIAEFFQPSDEPWSPPQYQLEQSPVAPLIGSSQIGNSVFYFCKAHPGFKNIHWQTIEHDIKFEAALVGEHLDFLSKFYQKQ